MSEIQAAFYVTRSTLVRGVILTGCCETSHCNQGRKNKLLKPYNAIRPVVRMERLEKYGVGPDEIRLLGLLSATLNHDALVGGDIKPISPHIVVLARQAKCLSIIAVLWNKNNEALDNQTLQSLSTDVQETVRSNFGQLTQTLACLKLFESSDIQVVAFKGIARQQQLYGRIDVRRSSDIDLLVPREDYEAACKLLMSNGYCAGVKPNSLWWHDYLGESPYIAPAPYSFVVDLHHQLQQPGAPAPRDIGAVLNAPMFVQFGAHQIQTLNAYSALLVSVIGYSKALRERQPWIIYAHEIVMARAAFTSEQENSFAHFATEQGMLRLTQSAFEDTDRLWKIARDFADGHSPDPQDMAFISGIFGKQTERLMRRSRLLWRWLDGSFVPRSAQFVRMAAHFYKSTFVRLGEEHLKR